MLHVCALYSTWYIDIDPSALGSCKLIVNTGCQGGNSQLQPFVDYMQGCDVGGETLFAGFLIFFTKYGKTLDMIHSLQIYRNKWWCYEVQGSCRVFEYPYNFFFKSSLSHPTQSNLS